MINQASTEVMLPLDQDAPRRGSVDPAITADAPKSDTGISCTTLDIIEQKSDSVQILHYDNDTDPSNPIGPVG